MRLIADSGSTKVTWRAIESDGSFKELRTAGINPLFQSGEEIVKELKKEIVPHLDGEVKEIHFYGAGVSSLQEIEALRVSFGELFPKANMEGYSDLLAAARALCGTAPGIAAIIGTGSNSCFYDGEKIADNVPACGYILGDEGGGAKLGITLLSNYFKRVLPEKIARELESRYNLNYGDVVRRVYREPYPNRYLASFAPFLSEMRYDPSIKEILEENFRAFFRRNILHYNYREFKVNIVGSIAFYFQEELREVANQFSIELGEIAQTPIEGLTRYHYR